MNSIQRLSLCWLSGLLLALTLATIAHAQDTSICTASILNRTTRVNPNGTFIIDNIPSNQGFGRIRIICPDTNSTRGGASNFIQIMPGGNVHVGGVPLGVIPPSVKSFSVTVTPTQLTSPGATAQFKVVATLSDGSTRDVTNGAEGTTYTSSNRTIGTVSPNGLVTAGTQSGTLIVSLVNDGVFASKMVTVNLTNDRDGDGMPDDFEEVNDCLDPDVPDGDVDPDGDGLSNMTEMNEGTNPCEADTDNDGLNDKQEIDIGSNPTLDDSDGDGLKDGAETNPTGDDDGDGKINILDPDRENNGLPDGIEVRICGTPTCALPNADSDGDGLSNLDEVGLGTDPANRDTDYDGLNDGAEVLNNRADPFDPDTDDDGFSDGNEVEGNSNPRDANSKPFNPAQPITVGDATSSVLSIKNITDPGQGQPIPPGDAISPVFSIKNTTDPGAGQPVPTGDAISPVFSIKNEAIP